MSSEPINSDRRVMLLAPTPRDGDATRGVLASFGIECIVCSSLDEVCLQIAPGVAAIILPEEAVQSDESDQLAQILRQQPVWSDLPVIVLTRSGAESTAIERAMRTLGNVSLIERPMRLSTLVSVVRSALRARERQYEVRDHLQAMRKAEERLERDATLLARVQDSVIVTDLHGIVTFWNEGATQLFGYESSEMIGKHYTARLSEPARSEITKWIDRIAVSGEEFHGEWQDEKRDGSPVWIEAATRRIADAAGNPSAIMGVSRDISERKRAESALAESEEKFRLLAETIPQLAWMAEPDGVTFWYNRRWYQYTGTTLAEMQGDGWQRVHDPQVLPEFIERWTETLRNGTPFEMEFPLRGADGQFRWFLTRVAPLRDAEGNITLWFGTNTDIQDKRRIAEERAHLLEAERTARVEAERSSRMKDEFLATLSHELRTPLNSILGWAQLLARGSDSPEELNQGLAIIERNARVQAQIIEDLLDMSRIISGKVRLDVKRTNLAEVVHSAIETVKPTADAKGVSITPEVLSAEAYISGDPNRLQQVMWNLLTNAIKFTPRGGGIRVLLHQQNSKVKIRVIDTGEGIRPEFLPFVFDRFRQADASTTRRHGGLGLGLAIVKQLAELHGGTIQVTSEGAGQGATFQIELPVASLGAPPTARSAQRSFLPPTTEIPETPLHPDLNGVRVLVVDDEPDARGLVRRLLEDCDAVVSTAGSAAEGLNSIRSDPPDVLISDIGMPVEDGYDFIQQVRALAAEQGGKIPAVALTAYARAEDRARSFNAGFQTHLAKPVEPAALIAIVADLAKRV